MASVDLGKADLALWSDPAQKVTLPHLIAAAAPRAYPGVVVKFAGDEFGTPFRGEGRARSWTLTVRFGAAEQDLAAALLALIELAADSPDQRLLLRTHYGQVPQMNDLQAVVIREPQVTPQIGLYVDISFTAEAVDGSAVL